jgi:hypothetical protein
MKRGIHHEGTKRDTKKTRIGMLFFVSLFVLFVPSW